MKQLIPTAFKFGSRIAPGLSAKMALQLFLRPNRTPRARAEDEVWLQGDVIHFQSGRVGRLYGKAGPLLFFVHGWEGRGSQWFRYVTPALEKGFRVLLWDGPAHGESPGKEANAILFAKAIIEDLVDLDESPSAILGHSMGGAAVALLPHFAVHIPRTVTIAAPTKIQGVFDRYFDLIQLQPEARKKAIQLMAESTGFSIEKASLMNTPIKNRLLMIHDSQDKEIPYSDFVSMKETHPQFSYVTTTGLGHRRILYSHDVIDQVLNFLTDTSLN